MGKDINPLTRAESHEFSHLLSQGIDNYNKILKYLIKAETDAECCGEIINFLNYKCNAPSASERADVVSVIKALRFREEIKDKVKIKQTER